MPEPRIKEEITIPNLQELVEHNLIEDGFLTPVVFICAPDGAEIIDATSFMEDDDTKDAMVDWLGLYSVEKHAHKIIIVSECWSYSPPPDMPKETVEELIKLGRYRHDFIRTEAYQILSITRSGTQALMRGFTRDQSDDTKITLGEVMDASEMKLDRFAPIQYYLSELN